jgi:hypothetical protein
MYTERDSKIGMWKGGALNLFQAQPVLKATGVPKNASFFGERLMQLNLKSLAMEAGHKFSGCPMSPEPIFESRGGISLSKIDETF